MLNIHHLELFYYVARHGGISEAVRKMPYGIQQPAVSGQILQLEETLGQPLFRRRPFELTPAGVELMQFIRPFFDNLDRMETRLSAGKGRLLRIAASSLVIRDHLPAVLNNLRARFDGLRFQLKEALLPQAHELIRRGEADCAITVLEGSPPPGCSSIKLIQLPLVLLVHSKSPLKQVATLWEQETVTDTLIALPEREPITQRFVRGLQQRGVQWPVSFEVSSLELIATYVAAGFGHGITIDVPGRPHPKGVRALPLEGFETIDVALIWQGEADPVVKALGESLQHYVQSLTTPTTA